MGQETLAILYQPTMASAAAIAQTWLQTAFPGVAVTLAGERMPNRDAWDNYLRQYDAAFLLAEVASPTECRYLLWLIDQPLGDTKQRNVFGVAGDTAAIVSGARVTEPDLLAKVACHEVGHLLGLAHCTGDCVMRPVTTQSELRRRPAGLCEACAGRAAIEAGITR